MGESLQKFWSRVAPALLAGAVAAFLAWSAGLLWASPPPRAALVLAALGWGLAFSLPAAWQSGRGVILTHAAAAAVGWVAALVGKFSWPAALPVWWLLVVLGATLLLARWLIGRSGRSIGAEAARLLLLGGAAWWVCRPMFTANLLGGLDARWYAYTLFDFIEQLRAGVFPVLVGQGPYQFNGAVHPFRFAPYFQYLGGVLDLATGRSLGGFALQHLTVIVSAFGGAATMYFSLTSLAPRLRWTAALVAVAYVLCPVWLGFLSFLDMYMSYMAITWLPLVFGGVARWFDRRDTSALVMVAVGLSITWACHAPVALWASTMAFGAMGAGWLSQGAPWRSGLRLAGMAGLFLALSAYHLFSIIEVTPPAANAPRAGFALAWVLLAVSAVGLWVVARRFLPLSAQGEAKPELKRATWLLAAGAAVLVVAGVAGGFLAATKDGTVVGTVAYTKIFWPAVLLPVHTPGALFSDVQPGYALWLLAALAMVAALRAAEPRAKLLGLALLVLTCFLLPFSHATEALWSLLPTSFLVATSGAVNLRLSPVWITLMAVAGFAALAWLAAAKPRSHRMMTGALAVLLAWSAFEANKLTIRLAALEYSSAWSEIFRRPENATLFIYSGNQIGSPGYFSNGPRDYRLESRVLDPQTFAVRSDLTLAAPPPVGKEISFTIRPAGGGWELEPHVTLLRDEPWVAFWKFSDWVPEGTLTLSSTNIYREYSLPSSGGEKSFGSGPTNSRALPLWTVSQYPEEVTVRFVPAARVDAAAASREFARVELRPLRDDWLPVHTRSLVPAYRAMVEARAPALLETCRTWAPGYKATRNGREVTPVRTPEGLVGVPLAPGPNEVVVRFAGTQGLRRMFFVSLAAWVGVLGWIGALVRKEFGNPFA